MRTHPGRDAAAVPYNITHRIIMFTILLILSASMGLGIIMRRMRIIKSFSEAAQYTVYAMLLVFGLSIGSNPDVMSRLGEFGLQATVLAFAGVAGSMLAAWLLYKFTSKKKTDTRP